MSEETWVRAIAPQGMTPSETLHHLGDCYLNYGRAVHGEEVHWDQWRAAGTTGEERWAAVRALPRDRHRGMRRQRVIAQTGGVLLPVVEHQ